MKGFWMGKLCTSFDIFNLGIIFAFLALISSVANASKYSAVVIDGNTGKILLQTVKRCGGTQLV